jgi:hypothetical protein
MYRRSLAGVRWPPQATRTNRLTTTIPIIAIRCIAIPPFHRAACQSTLLIDKFVPTIGALHLAVRADALDTLRRQCRLRLGNEIRQSLPDLGIGEDPLAVLADEGPSGHTRLWRPVKAVRIHKFVYLFVTSGGLDSVGDSYFLGSVASGSASIVTSTFAPFFRATSFPDSP